MRDLIDLPVNQEKELAKISLYPWAYQQAFPMSIAGESWVSKEPQGSPTLSYVYFLGSLCRWKL